MSPTAHTERTTNDIIQYRIRTREQQPDNQVRRGCPLRERPNRR